MDLRFAEERDATQAGPSFLIELRKVGGQAAYSK